MARVGAQRAAELTGKSKSTVQRAMNSGKISFELDANGRRIIDVSELERVFGLEKKDQPAGMTPSSSVQHELEKANSMIEMERLKMRITMLEQQLETAEDQVNDLKDQRDSWQKQATQVLLTSEYSQKQAEELKEELAERKRKSQERRQQALSEKMQKMTPHNQNAQAENTASQTSRSFWKKLTGSATS